MAHDAFGKVARRPIKRTKVTDLTDFSRQGLANETAEHLFPCRETCWHLALYLQVNGFDTEKKSTHLRQKTSTVI